jgi:outer membrane usher protein
VSLPSASTVRRVAALLVAGVCGNAAHAVAEPQLTELGGPALPPTTLFLELVVNDLATGRIVTVEHRDGHFLVAAEELQAVSIPLDRTPSTLVDPSELPDVRSEYDSHTQQLKLTVPPEWLPQQAIGGRLAARTPAVTSFGGVFNYDVHISSVDRGPTNGAVWTEQRLFDRWGTVSSNGVYRQAFGGRGDRSTRGYLRYDTMWSYSDERRMMTYSGGDLVTAGLPWSSPVRLGGFTIGRNFRVRPDVITYPVPEFAGQAAVPTAVELFVNGSQTATGTVPPGPFVINDMPLISGAGSATVVTTDALGRRVSTDINFYVANTLLRRGMVDFSLSGGAMRRQFGVRSFAYGKPAGVGVVRYGLTNFMTVAGHVEGGQRTLTGSLGADLRVGVLGVVSVGTALGNGMQAAARQVSADYSYTGRRISVLLRHLQRGSAFSDLTAYDRAARPGGTGGLSRRIDQATAAWTLNRRSGTLAAGYFNVVAANGSSTTRLANVSYTRSLVAGSSLYLTVNRAFGRERHTGVQAQVVVPLGRKGTVSSSVARRESKPTETRVRYSRSVPADGGIGWNADLAHDGRQSRQLDLTWRTSTFQVQGGTHGAGQDRTRWAGLSGSAVVMGGGVFPTNRVSDAFVLVDTDGHRDVPVLLDNQVVGRTDRRGHLLVPWVSSFYGAKYEIDPLRLPADVRVPFVQQRIAVRRHSGAVLRFPIEAIVATTIKLVDAAGQPLPLGQAVTHQESGQTAIVGWDGIIYLEGLRPRNTLVVRTGPDTVCRASFDVKISGGEIPRVGPLVCR